MSKITRIYHRIFGSTSTTTQMAAFGSYKNSAVQMTTDASTVASLPNWLVGMAEGVVNRNAPIIEELNGVLHHSSRQIAYLLQSGVAEYDASTTYYTDGFVVHDSLLYQSIRDNHVGYDPTTSATTWQIYPKSQYPSYATTTSFTTARGAAVEGSKFYDSTLKIARAYLNGIWRDMQLSKGNESYATTTAFVAANGAAIEGSEFYDTTLKSKQIYRDGAWRKGINPTLQIFTNPSGTQTYITPAGVTSIKIRMVGGGGGGAGGGASPTTAGNGGDTTFGTLTATKGNGGAGSNGGGGGGAASGGNIANMKGGAGGGGVTGNPYSCGGAGGNSAFGGGGAPGALGGGAGGAAAGATGGGGGGGGTVASHQSGTGGGAGGYVEHLINNPGTSYSYAVGAAGAAGATGGDAAGGAGGAGCIIVEEYYN